MHPDMLYIYTFVTPPTFVLPWIYLPYYNAFDSWIYWKYKMFTYPKFNFLPIKENSKSCLWHLYWNIAFFKKMGYRIICLDWAVVFPVESLLSRLCHWQAIKFYVHHIRILSCRKNVVYLCKQDLTHWKCVPTWATLMISLKTTVGRDWTRYTFVQRTRENRAVTFLIKVCYLEIKHHNKMNLIFVDVHYYFNEKKPYRLKRGFESDIIIFISYSPWFFLGWCV